MWGRKVREPITAPFTARSTTQRLPPEKAACMGDEGKAAGCVPPAALLSLNFSLFVLAITSQYFDLKSHGLASDIQGRWRTSPIRPEDVNFGPDLEAGPSFLCLPANQIFNGHALIAHAFPPSSLGSVGA